MPPIYIAYLNRLDIEELKITDDGVIDLGTQRNKVVYL